MFCPNCGSKIADAAAFCPNCGIKLQAAEPATARPVEPKSERPVVVREPATARPVVEPPVYEEPKSYEAPAYDEPDQDVVAPADYTTVNIILLVVSVLSCCVGSMFLCPNIIPIVTSIIGIVMGSACKKAIAAGDMTLAASKSKTAKIMWIVSAAALALSIILCIILLVAGVGMGALEGVMAEMNW